MQDLKNLSPRAARGMCLMPRLEVDEYGANGQYADQLRRYVADGDVGGFCVFGGSAERVISVCDELRRVRSNAGLPILLFSADCEFGLPMRLRQDGTEFPDAMAIAHADSAGDGSLTTEAAECISREMALLGLHWNFAPVADINSDPSNPIINTRSFGERAETVSLQTQAFARGLAHTGIIATAKHFPGHGDTQQDSHRELPYLHGGLEEFEQRELRPFRDLIESGIPSIMTAHVAAPDLARDLGATTEEERRLPATLSSYLTQRLLRERMNFNGVVVTDALEMKAVSDGYGPSDTSRLAFAAGADILLLPTDVESTLDGISSVIDRDPSRLNASVDRLMKLRGTVREPVDSQKDRLDKFQEQCRRSQVLSKSIAEAAIETTGRLEIPVDTEIVILTDERDGAVKKAGVLADSLRDREYRIRLMTFAESLHYAFDDPFVLVTFHRARGYIGGIDMAASATLALERIAAIASRKLHGLVLVGSPYVDRLFSTPAFVIKTFSEALSSVEAVSNILLRSR